MDNSEGALNGEKAAGESMNGPFVQKMIDQLCGTCQKLLRLRLEGYKFAEILDQFPQYNSRFTLANKYRKCKEKLGEEIEKERRRRDH